MPASWDYSLSRDKNKLNTYVPLGVREDSLFLSLLLLELVNTNVVTIIVGEEEKFMCIVSVRMSDQEKELLDAYAKLNDLSISEAVKKALFEQLEDEFDVKAADEAHAEFVKNPIVVSADELKQKYGL
jgi:hypothetical protein